MTQAILTEIFFCPFRQILQQYLYQATFVLPHVWHLHIRLIYNRVRMIHVPGQTRTQGNEPSNSVAKRKDLEVHLQNLNWHVHIHVPSVQ